MKLYLFEMYRLYKNKRLNVLVITMVLLQFIFLYQGEVRQQIFDYGEFSPSVYARVVEEVNRFASPKDALEYFEQKKIYMQWMIENEGGQDIVVSAETQAVVDAFSKEEDMEVYFEDPFSELRFITRISEDLEKVVNYDSFINNIQDRANKSSAALIFVETGFSYRSLIKQSTLYEGMDVQPTYDVSEGMEMAFSFPFTDLIILFTIVLLCNALITKDKITKNNMLVRTMNRGRGSLIIAKVCSIFTYTSVVVLLVYVGNLWIASLVYGLGDMGRAIQSLPSFQSATMQIDVFTYILLFLVSKLSFFLCIVLFISVLCVVLYNQVIIYACICALVVMNVIVVSVFDLQSSFMLFNCLSLLSLSNTNQIYSSALQVNVAGYPISYILSYWVSLGVCSLISVCVMLRCMQVNVLASAQKVVSFWKTKASWISQSGFMYEQYKLYIRNKILVVLILFTAFHVYTNIGAKISLRAEELFVKEYISSVEGRYTKEKDEKIVNDEMFIETQLEELQKITADYYSGELDKQTYDVLYAKYQPYESIHRYFQPILAQNDYLSSQSKQGRELSFVNVLGVERVIGLNNLQDANDYELLLLILLLVGYTSIYCYDYKQNSNKLIQIYGDGKRILKWKFYTGCLYSALCFAIVYIPYMVKMFSTYGASSLLEPAASISLFSYVPSSINIITWIVFIYIIKFLVHIGIMIIVFFISKQVKDQMNAILISVFLFATPFILSVIGIHVLNDYTLYPLMYTFDLLYHFNLIYFIVASSLYSVCIGYALRKLFKKEQI